MSGPFTAPLTKGRFGCALCGEVFATLAAFDKHHAGKGTANLRCKAPERMKAMTRSEQGVWTMP